MDDNRVVIWPMRCRKSLRSVVSVQTPRPLGGSVHARTTQNRSRTDHRDVPKLDWKPCDDGFECAQAEVPTDYDKPRGTTTTIALIKLPAAKPDQKIGSLFTNPGGPGGSGVDFIKSGGKGAYSQAVRDRFDVIGFDPRAVGASDPATCFVSQEEEKAFVATLPAFPVTRSDARDFLPKDAAFARACAERSGERIKHSSTANVARDMDLLRRAVGDEKLSYVDAEDRKAPDLGRYRAWTGRMPCCRSPGP